MESNKKELFILFKDKYVSKYIFNKDISIKDIIDLFKVTDDFNKIIAIALKIDDYTFSYFKNGSKKYPEGCSSYSLLNITETPAFTYKVKKNLLNIVETTAEFKSEYVELPILNKFSKLYDILPIVTEKDCIGFIDFLQNDLSLSFHPDDNFEDYLDNDNSLLLSNNENFKFDSITIEWFDRLIENMFFICEDKLYDLFFANQYKVTEEIKETCFVLLDSGMSIEQPLTKLMLDKYPTLKGFETLTEIINAKIEEIKILWEEKNLENPNKQVINLQLQQLSEEEIEQNIVMLNEGFKAVNSIVEILYNVDENFTSIFNKNYPFKLSFDELTIKIEKWTNIVAPNINSKLFKVTDISTYKKLMGGILAIQQSLDNLRNINENIDKSIIDKYFNINANYPFDDRIFSMYDIINEWLNQLLNYKIN
jgi:hypothetical protein